MAVNIEESFLTKNKSVYDFLNQSGQGLYIPLYQREYSWDNDNIEQLLDDLSRGIFRLASGEVTEDSKEIRFMGTIITVVEPNESHIDPIDPEAVPPRIEKLIDGQQRVSTIALMATLLVKRLKEIKVRVSKNNQLAEHIKEICEAWTEKLLTIFSFDLRRGTPRWKPKIIRGQTDYWTRNHDVDKAYTSELSNYLGHFIKAHFEGTDYPSLSAQQKYGDTSVYKNGRKIENWLKTDVASAHINQNEDFATAWDIISNVPQSSIWEFERKDFVDIINKKDFSTKKTDSYILCELVQTLSVCHYLLDRCCFTIIQPTDDDWAFDMFQSLNATGTPLTAIETFKPTIVNTVSKIFHQKYKDSLSDTYFKKVENFLSDDGKATAQQKNKRTNDYLTSFYVALNGISLASHFSLQRKELEKTYNQYSTIEEKDDFIKRMGNYAEFYNIWINYDGKNNAYFPNIGSNPDANLASMLILFLKASNHKMAITILATMYYDVIERKNDAVINFIDAVKAVSAYYFLWRSTFSNSGLDNTYREFFKELKGGVASVKLIKDYFKSELSKPEREINTKDLWKTKALNSFKYNSAGDKVVRLALLIAAHDTMAAVEKGLIKVGRDTSANYLCLEQWLSSDLKTIEHIAPQKNKENQWDADLYNPQVETYHSLGNLTLLPQDLNSSASNKGWKEKYFYYKCVAEQDPEVVKNIEVVASKHGVTLNPDTIEKLKECKYNTHLASLSSLGADGVWNKDLVDKRTNIILDLLWERVSKWIF